MKPTIDRWLLVCALLLAGMLYLPTLRYGFVWDDRALIVENQDLATDNPLPFFAQSFTHYWASKGLVPHGYYRPLVILSFWLERRLFGLNPAVFHGANVLWNALAGILLALVYFQLLGRFLPALLAGLVFVLHPTHVESVAFVSGRTDLMMTVFLLAALLVLPVYRRQPTWWSAGIIVIAYASALLCKETAILFPVLVVLLLHPGFRLKHLRRHRYLFGALILVAIGYLIVRASVLSGPAASWGAVTPGQRVLLVVNAFGRYLMLTVMPFFHRLTWPDLVEFARPGLPTVTGILGFAGLLLLSWHCRDSAIGLGALWFLLFLLPACNFFPPGPSYLSERLLYLPSAGIILLLAAVLGYLSRKPALTARYPVLVLVPVVLLLGAFSLATIRRMPVWRDAVTLHKAMVNENPEDGTAYSSLAHALKDNNDLPGALAAYRRAAELQPQNADVQYDLAEALRAAGELRAAAEAYRRAAALNPKSGELQTSLGNVLIEIGDVAGAVAAYRQAVRLTPGSAVARNNLGVALLQAGDSLGAEQEFRQALNIQPGLALALNNLGELMLSRDRLDSAELLFRRTIASQPEYVLGHYNLGVVLQRQGRFAAAESAFRQALRLMPDFAPARQRLTGK